jgi:mono/diheme cytochrome c family protein
MALLLPLLLIALYHHAVVADDWLASLARRLADRLVNLVSSVRLESALGLGVILVAALLTATPPPVPPDARGKAETPSQTQTVGGLDVKLSIDPGAAGGNSYEVDLSQGGQPLAGAQVRLRFTDPALDKRSNLLSLDDMGDGSYLGAGADLERPGGWQALVDALNIPGKVPPTDVRAAFRWNVPDVAPNANTRQPSPLNWLSGAAILAILGVWLIPGTIRRVRSLHLQTEIVVAGVMVTIITIVLVVMGGWLVSQANQRTDALRNPTPAVVNPALADAGSLAAGQTVYETRCAVCHGPTGAGNGPQAPPDTPDLRLRLPTRRDEDLYRLLAHTGSGINLQLSEAERWNVINYLRSPVFAPVATPTPGK